MAGNPREHLRPGETVRVSIIAEKIENTIAVPSAAIVPSQDGSASVMVVGPDSIAHARKIKAGVQQAYKSQILEGVKPGEKVIIVGALGLEDNAKVRIETAAPHE